MPFKSKPLPYPRRMPPYDRKALAQCYQVHHVAYWIGKSKSQVRRMAASGKLPAFKSGRMWMFRDYEIRKWIVERQYQELEAERVARGLPADPRPICWEPPSD